MSDQNSNIDFNKVINIAKTLSTTQDNIVIPNLSPIDKTINNQDLRIMKATLPYFDYPQQKKFALLIKLLEFRKTMEIFNAPEIHTAIYEKKELNKLDFLQDIKNSCDEPNQKKLNLLISLINMKTTMDNAKNNQNLMSFAENEQEEKKEEPSANNDYNHFINMVNKIIDEKEGENS